MLTRYGRDTRTRAIRAYGLALLFWTILLIPLEILIWFLPWPAILHVQHPRLVTYGISMAGASFGALLVFVLRSLPEDWPSLVAAASDTVKAHIRAGYVLGFSFVAILMLRTRMVTIGVSDLKSVSMFPDDAASSSLVSAMLIGIFFGLADLTLPTIVQQRARDTTGRLKGS